jgi:hypothetical protein
MLLTKDDATKKWCPLARSEYYSACKCIADGCAMWRWTTITNPSNGARRFQGRTIQPPRRKKKLASSRRVVLTGSFLPARNMTQQVGSSRRIRRPSAGKATVA